MTRTVVISFPTTEQALFFLADVVFALLVCMLWANAFPKMRNLVIDLCVLVFLALAVAVLWRS